MRVICPRCHSKACGGSFVYKLSHSHDLNPPRHNTLQIANALIKSMHIEERLTLPSDIAFSQRVRPFIAV